jgi:hypothetical protein
MNSLRSWNQVRFLICTLAGAALAGSFGCGPGNKASVSGKVTYKGAAVPGATIQLKPASGDGPAFPVVTGADGAFSAPDVPLGQMQVSIESAKDPSAMPDIPVGMRPPAGVTPPAANTTGATGAIKAVQIPAKYGDPKNSGLNWDIKPGTNTKNFELTD